MSSGLKEVYACCTALKESTKIKERKDSLDRLRSLFEVSTVVQDIDDCTTDELHDAESDRHVQITWPDVVISLLAATKKDLERKGTKKSEYPAVLRQVIKTADARGPKLFLAVRDVVQHLVDGLEDDNLSGIAGPDYSSILVESICSVVGYCHLFSKQSFNDLIRVFYKRLLSTESFAKNEAMMHAKALAALITSFPFDLTPFYQKLHQFFELFFATYTKDHKIAAILFSGLNRLLIACGVNVRTEAKALGTSLSKFILQNWATTNSELKEQFVLFYRIQMRLHRSFTGKIERMEKISELYQEIIKELNSLRKSRLSFQRDDKLLTFELEKQLLNSLDLSADVLAQMNDNNEIEVGDSVSEGEQGKRKRRKLSNIWEIFSTAIEEELSSNSLVPCLQLLYITVTKHTNLLPPPIQLKIINGLASILERAKDQSLIEGWSLQALLSLVKCSEVSTSGEGKKDNQLIEAWKCVWSMLLRKISYFVPNVMEKGLLLLRAMIQLDLIDNQLAASSQDKIWKLNVFDDSARLHSPILEFVIEFISKYELQEETSVENLPRREKLLQWLFSYLSSSKLSFARGQEYVNPRIIALSVHLITRLGRHTTSQRIEKFRESRKENETQELEFQLAQIEGSISLYANKGSQNPGESEDVVIAASRNQIPTASRMAQRKLLLDFLKGRADDLLREGNELNARKRKTLGVDRLHLSRNLSSIIHHCHLIASLLSLSVAVEGQEYYQPDVPKCLESMLLHLVDNLDKIKSEEKVFQRILEQMEQFVPVVLEFSSYNQVMMRLFGILADFMKLKRTPSGGIAANIQDSEDSLDLDLDMHIEDASASKLNDTGSEHSFLICCRILSFTGSLQFFAANGKALADILGGDLSTTKVFAICSALLKFASEEFRLAVLKKLEGVLLTPELSGEDKIRLKILEQIRDVATCINKDSKKEPTEKDTKQVTSKCMSTIHTMLNVFLDLWKAHKLHWSTRRQFAEAIQVFLTLEDLDNFEPFADLFLKLIKDEDYRVRVYMTKAITVFFELFEDETGILNDINKHLPKPSDLLAVEYTVTALATLGEIACVSAVNEKAILLQLCCYFNEKELVSYIIQHISSVLSYPNVPMLMEAHLDFLLSKWTQEKMLLSEFPIYLCGVADFTAFLERYVHVLLPQMVFVTDKAGILNVASTLGVTAKELLKNNFSYIFAKNYPLYYSGHESMAEEICDNFLKQFLGEHNPNTLIPRELDSIIINLLNVLSFDNDPKPPSYSAETVSKVLEMVAESWKLHISDLLYKARNSDRVFNIVLYLNEQLVTSHRRNDRVRWLRVFAFLITLLKEKICKPSVLRDVVHSILRFIGDKYLQDLCCDILREICLKAIASKDKAGELGRHLNVIITTLIPFAHARYISGSKKENKPLNIINTLISPENSSLSREIASLDPFPEGEPFNEINAKYHSLRDEWSLADEIERFVASKSKNRHKIHSSPVTYLARLSHLKEQLKGNKPKLNELLKKDQQRQLIDQLIWHLIRECTSPNDEIKTKAGECLGELGAVDPYGIAFFFPTEEIQLQNSSKDVLLPGKMLILGMLNTYLTDSDVSVIRLASNCLKEILSTDSGLEAMSELQEEIQNYLMPLKKNSSPKSTKKAKQVVLTTEPLDLESTALWNPALQTYQQWICSLSYSLTTLAAGDEVLRLCANFCQTKAQFAEAIFPFLIYDIVNKPNGKHCKIVSKCITDFLTLESSDGSTLSHTQLILTTLNFLRKQMPKTSASDKRFWQLNMWRDVNLLEVARAAKRCSAYFTSLLYVELWCEKEFGQLQAPNEGMVNSESMLMYEKLMLDIYSNINEPDGIYGVNRTSSVEAQIITYEHEANWPKAIGVYDMVLQQTKELSQVAVNQSLGLLSSLQNLGHYHLLDMYLKGFATKHPNNLSDLSEFQFQNAWRSCKWELDPKESQLLESRERVDFHIGAFICLRALHDGNSATFWSAIKQARLELIKNILLISVESTKSVYPALVNLEFFSEIETAWKLKSNSKGASLKSEMLDLIHCWEESSTLMENNFDLFEPVLALRKVLLQITDSVALLPRHLLLTTRLANKAGRYQIASNTIYELKQNSRFANDLSWRLEEAKILWKQGEQDKAINIGKSLLGELKEGKKENLYVDSLYSTGKWLAQTKSEGTDIAKKYLQEAVEKYHSDQHEKVCKAYFTLANYADGLYQSLITKLKSSEWATSQELRKHKEKELQECKKILNSNARQSSKVNRQDLLRFVSLLERQCQLDKEENNRMDEDRKTYLFDAVSNYVRCLLNGDKYDIRVMFRLCSLWFNNYTNEDINRHLKKNVAGIPARKFLPLFYQIASRMSTENSTFQMVLNNVIESAITNHPHHSLYQIYALSNGERVNAVQKGKNRFMVDTDKINAATSMINRMRTSKHKTLLLELELLIDAYIDLAFLDVSDKKKETKPILLPSALRKARGLKHVVVPTINTAVDPSCEYKDIIHVLGFSDHFHLVGGLNLPKRIECHGSDGKKYTQLVKGRDDLRQDAVMQQMFSLVNTLLLENPETRKRRLKIRTYKVIPLTPCAGLLEWVENTIPIGEYLIGSTKDQLKCAHVRYRPKDKLSLDCRRELSEANEQNKLKKFLEVCECFRPVFHHFFLENFPDPAEWFAKRLTYTRSVASNSIVGYVVGLGDRHSQNILIDKTSAELVHIDLGVAFEQGKTLRTPEVVPFRLTRDIVDGMGITGVEGVFRRCCEATMSVLRTHHSSLLTILEVFIHDPLYNWALSPLQALRLQRDDAEVESNLDDVNPGESSGGTGNTDAERALLRLKQKLQGYEYGEALTVTGQTNQLINEAQDNKLLCRMFPGWAPWV